MPPLSLPLAALTAVDSFFFFEASGSPKPYFFFRLLPSDRATRNQPQKQIKIVALAWLSQPLSQTKAKDAQPKPKIKHTPFGTDAIVPAP
jgi:hypothetical protein